MEKRKRLTSIVFLAGLLALSVVIHAGSLEPSVPPGPTMKTLDEVEPRVPISSLPYTISASGSYYLTGDLTTDSNSISVEANDVTIDLMGYSLTGSGSAGCGAWMGYSPKSNIEIRNGTVRNFLLGVGAMFANHRNVRIIGLRVHGNTAGGLILEVQGCLVKDCTVSGNAGGINCGIASTVVGNVVDDNGYSGIRAGSGSTVTGNTVTDNNSVGISVDYVCTVSENTVANNTYGGIDANSGCSVTHNTVGSNGGCGIVVLDASTASGNTASYNTEDGIQVNGRSNITYNTCVGNGFGGDGAGIHVITGSTGSHVEGNNVTGNDTGIDVDACCNIIIKNTARENTIDYSIDVSNSYGPIVNVAGVGDISSDPNAAHPWANFEF
ncbi:MAG: right-handed parallel beta-helix repeat-containing protein [Planctomycetota bacterium]|jgi:parallel beta-helix repeat protein